MTAGSGQATSELAIRPAHVGDAPALAALAQEFHTHLSALDEPGAPPEPVALTAAVLHRDGFGEEPWFSILLAERAGAPVGYLLYHFGYWVDSASRALFVCDLFVREGARRQGVWQGLMAEAAAILRRQGGTLILWTIWDRNPAAMGFYKSLGAMCLDEEIIMTWPAKAWPDG